jgi:LPXTG-motif cell wall-anchored protein
MKLTTQLTSRLLLAAAVCAVFTAMIATAQDRTTTTTTAGAPMTTYQVERGEVTYVSGNDLIVKMDSGVVRYFNVPDSARATVDGKELSVHELKPGMKLQRTISTTETPKSVTTVRTIQGKVVQVIAPLTVILSFPQGPNKEYHIPAEQKFVVDGKSLTVFDLRPGMLIGATAVTTAQEVSVAQARNTTGTAPPPPVAAAPKPATPPMQGALLIEVPAAAPPPPAVAAAPAPARAPAPAPEPAPVKLPKTGSNLPLIGLLGLLSCAASLGLSLLRRS